MDGAARNLGHPRRGRRPRRMLAGTLSAAVIAALLAGCSGGSARPSASAAGPPAAAVTPTGSPDAAAPSSGASSSGAAPLVSPWPAPTSSPQIAAAQSQIGAIGKTLLTWASAGRAIGVSIDYITDYQPAAGFTVPKGQRAIQLDVRIVNASDQPLELANWTIYADIDNKALAAVTDANFVDISKEPPVPANSNGYLPARILIPAAGGQILIGVTDPDFPQQPATFGVSLS